MACRLIAASPARNATSINARGAVAPQATRSAILRARGGVAVLGRHAGQHTEEVRIVPRPAGAGRGPALTGAGAGVGRHADPAIARNHDPRRAKDTRDRLRIALGRRQNRHMRPGAKKCRAVERLGRIGEQDMQTRPAARIECRDNGIQIGRMGGVARAMIVETGADQALYIRGIELAQQPGQRAHQLFAMGRIPQHAERGITKNARCLGVENRAGSALLPNQ
jgi:hypothetical protein